MSRLKFIDMIALIAFVLLSSSSLIATSSCKTIQTIGDQDTLINTADCTVRNVLKRGPEIYDKVVQIYTEGTDVNQRLWDLVADIGGPGAIEIIACVSGSFAMEVDKDLRNGASVAPQVIDAHDRAVQWLKSHVENKDKPFDPPLESIQ